MSNTKNQTSCLTLDTLVRLADGTVVTYETYLRDIGWFDRHPENGNE